VRIPRDQPRSAHHLKVISFLIFKSVREQIHCPYSCTPVVAEAGAVEVEDEVVRRVEVVVIASDDDVEDVFGDVDDTEVFGGQAMETHSPEAGSSPGWQL
jgi:hypothetical protein